MKKRSLHSAATGRAEEERSSGGMQESAGRRSEVEGWRIKPLEQTGCWWEVKRRKKMRKRRRTAGGTVGGRAHSAAGAGAGFVASLITDKHSKVINNVQNIKQL